MEWYYLNQDGTYVTEERNFPINDQSFIFVVKHGMGHKYASYNILPSNREYFRFIIYFFSISLKSKNGGSTDFFWTGTNELQDKGDEWYRCFFVSIRIDFQAPEDSLSVIIVQLTICITETHHFVKLSPTSTSNVGETFFSAVS